ERKRVERTTELVRGHQERRAEAVLVPRVDERAERLQIVGANSRGEDDAGVRTVRDEGDEPIAKDAANVGRQARRCARRRAGHDNYSMSFNRRSVSASGAPVWSTAVGNLDTSSAAIFLASSPRFVRRYTSASWARANAPTCTPSPYMASACLSIA